MSRTHPFGPSIGMQEAYRENPPIILPDIGMSAVCRPITTHGHFQDTTPEHRGLDNTWTIDASFQNVTDTVPLLGANLYFLRQTRIRNRKF
jgi:hypothetical protein